MKHNTLPLIVDNLKNFPQDQWINLIKQALKQQAQEFDDMAIEYALNPSVRNTYRECAAKLRTKEEQAFAEKIFNERIKIKEKEMGLSKESKHPLEEIADHINENFPNCSSLKDASWLDIFKNDLHIVVQWYSQNKFGVSLVDDDTGYGTLPDNIFENIKDTITHIAEILNKQ